MSIKFRCSHCDALLKATSDLIGERIECWQCGKMSRVPDDNNEPSTKPRNYKKTATGMSIACLILGILGLLSSIFAGGPFACAFCCPLTLPVSWFFSLIGLLFGAVGIVLGFIARRNQDRHAVNVWGISLSVIAICSSVLAIIFQFTVAAVAIDDAAKVQIEEKKKRDEIDSKRKSRKELTSLLIGKNGDEAIRLIGRPEQTTGNPDDVWIWRYKDIAKDDITGKPDEYTYLHFRNKIITKLTSDPSGR